MTIRLAPRTPGERMRRAVQRATKWVRLHLGSSGHGLPSYEQSREELGGLPWRRFEKTDAWFVGSAPALLSGAYAAESEEFVATQSVSDPLPASIATSIMTDDAPDLRTPILSRRALALGGGALALSLCLVLVLGRSTAPAPATLALVAPTQVTKEPALATPAEAPARPSRQAKAAGERPGKHKLARAQARVSARRL